MEYKQNVQMLHEHYVQSLSVVKDNYLSGLLEGKIQVDNLEEQALRYDLDLMSKNWVVSVVRMDKERFIQPLSIQQRERNLISAKNLLDESLMRFCRTNSFVYGGHIVIIAMLDAEYMVRDLLDKISRICKISNYFLKFGLSAGVGVPCDNLNKLNLSYANALNALSYQVFRDANQAIYFGDIEYDGAVQLKFNEQDEYELLGAVKLGSADEIRGVIDKLFARFGLSLFPFNQYQIFLFEMLAVLVNLVRSYKLNVDEVFNGGFRGYMLQHEFDSLQSLSNWVFESCLNINMIIKRERMSSTKLTVERAKQFVDEHYSDSEISVEMLCEYLHISPAYFSTIFKRESGMNFVDYLTKVRLDAAVKLLNSTEKKFSSICAIVGYTDPNYFSYVFKKHFGISPSKYKNQ